MKNNGHKLYVHKINDRIVFINPLLNTRVKVAIICRAGKATGKLNTALTSKVLIQVVSWVLILVK